MLHLVDKKFVEIFEYSNKNNKSIYLHNHYAPHTHHTCFFNILNKKQGGECVYQYNTLDDALNDLGGMQGVLQSFIDTDSSDRLVYIYADYHDYLRIMCSWFKSVIPGYTFSSFKDMVIRDIAKFKFLRGRYFSYRTDSRHQLHGQQFLAHNDRYLEDVVLEEFEQYYSIAKGHAHKLQQIWDAAPVVELQVASTALSLECQMARYLIDGDSWEHAEQYKQTFVDFVLNEVLTDFIEEFKAFMLENIFNLKNLEEFQGFNPIKNDLKEWMGDTHPFKFITDINFTSNNLAYIKDNYDLVALGELYNKYTHQEFRLDMALYLRQDYQEIFEHEFNQKYGFRYLTEHRAKSEGNPYLFMLIHKLWRTKPERLVEFAV